MKMNNETVVSEFTIGEDLIHKVIRKQNCRIKDFRTKNPEENIPFMKRENYTIQQIGYVKCLYCYKDKGKYVYDKKQNKVKCICQECGKEFEP